MSVIWKYQLDVLPTQLAYLPQDARILDVGVQNDFPVVWYLTEGAGVELQQRIFSIVTTGERFTLPHLLSLWDHIGTVTLGKDMTSNNPSAWYVAHVFAGHLTIEGNKAEDRQELIKELKTPE